MKGWVSPLRGAHTATKEQDGVIESCGNIKLKHDKGIASAGLLRRYAPRNDVARKALGVLGLLLLCAGAASAADIRSVRFHTKPEYVFVNQPFELFCEVELPVGSDMSDWRLLDFPGNSERFSCGPFQDMPKIQRKLDGGKTVVDVRRFKAQANAAVAGDVLIRPRLVCMLTERVERGFFTSSYSQQKQYAAQPFTLQILSLPEAGRPAHFSGAVGTLKLDASLSATTVRPEDILTLSVSVSGNGDLRTVAIPLPQEAQGFKVYPAKETAREMSSLHAEQVYIPQSTNAVEIGAIRFCYFNPVTRRYEEVTAGPFRITFMEAAAEPATNAVRVISTAATVPAGAQGVTLEKVNHGIRRFLPLMVFCAFALVACFVFFQLYGTHTRIGIAVAALLLAAGGGVTYHLRTQPEQATRTIAGRAEIRFAPSENAKVLFVLHADTPVLPIETAGDWIRVDYAGRRGWLPARVLRD